MINHYSLLRLTATKFIRWSDLSFRLSMAHGITHSHVMVFLTYWQHKRILCWKSLHLFNILFKCNVCKRFFFFLNYCLSQSFPNIHFPNNQVNIDRSFQKTNDILTHFCLCEHCFQSADFTLLLCFTWGSAAAFWTLVRILYQNP